MDDGEGGLYLKCQGTKKNGSPCAATLAARVAGLFVVRRRGFEMIAEGVRSVKCESCGTSTRLNSDLAKPRIELRGASVAARLREAGFTGISHDDHVSVSFESGDGVQLSIDPT